MDFSHYGEATEEWISYISAPPMISPGLDQARSIPAEIYASGTAIRAAQDHEKPKASGLEGKFTTRDHKVATPRARLSH
jgi:hypothetical protein